MSKPKKIVSKRKYKAIDVEALYRGKRKKLPRLVLMERIQERGLSWGQLAEIAKVEFRTNIAKMAKQENPSLHTLKLFALLLDCKIKDLIEE